MLHYLSTVNSIDVCVYMCDCKYTCVCVCRYCTFKLDFPLAFFELLYSQYLCLGSVTDQFFHLR